MMWEEALRFKGDLFERVQKVKVKEVYVKTSLKGMAFKWTFLIQTYPVFVTSQAEQSSRPRLTHNSQ